MAIAAATATSYANEMLQQRFTQDVFKTVQNEYEDEG